MADQRRAAWIHELRRQLFSARKARGWSRAALADRVGVHQQTVFAWEAGDYAPDGWRLAVVVAALGLDPAEVLRLPAEAPIAPQAGT